MFKPRQSAAAATPLADVAAQAIAALAAKIEADPESSRLRERLPVVRQRKTDAEAQLTLAQRQYAEAFDAASRRHSVDEQVRRLLDGDDAPAPTVTDAEVRAARRSLTVADQALREAEQRFATRRADVVREIVLETALPALRRQAHDTALTLARLLAQCAATAEYLETLRLADMLPDGPFVAQWQPGFVLPNPLELQNPVAHSLREMIAAGVVTAAEVETAAGAPLPVGWDTGRLPPDPRQEARWQRDNELLAKRQGELAACAPEPSPMLRVTSIFDRAGRRQSAA